MTLDAWSNSVAPARRGDRDRADLKADSDEDLRIIGSASWSGLCMQPG